MTSNMEIAERLMETFWQDFKSGPRYKNGKAIGTSYSHNKAVESIAAALAAKDAERAGCAKNLRYVEMAAPENIDASPSLEVFEIMITAEQIRDIRAILAKIGAGK